MKIRTVKYYVSEGFVGVLKNGVMSLASIATVASCIFIMVFSYCLATNIDYSLKQLEKVVGVTTFIDDSLSAEEVDELYSTISKIPNIESVHYVSADDALEELREVTGDVNGIMAGLKDDNPLPRSFTITINSLENQETVIAELEKMVIKKEGIYRVRHVREKVAVLLSISSGIQLMGVIIMLSLAALSIVIITNTIMLTVNNRKGEINIMKYVGATDWFIRWPFIIEGMIIGFTGALIPLTICFFGYNQAIDFLQNNITVIDSTFSYQPRGSVFATISPIAILLGFAIGTIGSSTSVRKYLNV